MNVIFIEPAGAGGISHCTYALAKTLGQQGTHCEILTGVRWLDRPLPETVRVRRIFNGMQTNPFRLWMTCFRLRKNVDVVHWQCSTYPRLILGLMKVIPFKRIPWVYTVHNVLPHETNESSLDLYGKTYRQMRGLIFHTEYSRHTFQQTFPRIDAATAIIPLGEYSFLLGRNEYSVRASEQPVILFFGNIRPYKGLDILIQAMPDLRKRVPEARLIIAGQTMGSFEPYENLIRELNLQSCVETRFGYIPDEEIPALLQSAAVAALPYRDIDQSAALMVMVAYGKAIVATRVGGIPEVIRDGETGLLVPPNDPRALTDAVAGLLLDRVRAERLGNNARADAYDRFSWERIAKQTLSFYQKVSSL